MNALAEFSASLTNNVALLLVAMPLIGSVLVRLMSRSGREPVYFTALTNVWLCCGLVALAVPQLEPRSDFAGLFRPQMLTSLEWPGFAEATPSDAAVPLAETDSMEPENLSNDGSNRLRRFPTPRISVAVNGLNLWFVALTVAATAAAVASCSKRLRYVSSEPN